MPVFGKSLFETVLDGMEVEDDGGDEGDEEVLARQPRITAHFLADTSFVDRADERPLAELYEDFGEPPSPEALTPPSPEPPTWLYRLSEQDIADDLGLAAGMSGPQIREKRRLFARSNHPDRVAEHYREAATIRMTTANRLVEAALRRI